MQPRSLSIALTSLAIIALIPPAHAERKLDLYGDLLPDGALVRMGSERLRHPFALRAVFAADGKTLISAGRDQTVRFWDLETGKMKSLQRVPSDRRIENLAADGKTLALASKEHLILWDIDAAREVGRIETGNPAGNNRIGLVEISPDGKKLAGPDGNGSVFLWDAVSGKELAHFKHKDGRINHLIFGPKGKILAAASALHILLWDCTTGKELHLLKSPRHPYAGRVCISPDGKVLVDAQSKSVLLWDVATGKELATLEFFDGDKKLATGHEVAFSPDGKTIAIYCNENGFVVLWDRTTRKEVKRFTTHRSRSWDAAELLFSPDGKQLASLRAGKITLWDVSSGKQLQDRPGHFADPQSVALSPDGKWLASACGADQTVRLWDAHTGKSLHVLPMPITTIRSITFTPDSSNVIAGGWTGDPRMWDVRSGEQRHVFRVPPVAKDDIEMIAALQLSPDGKRLTAMSLRGETKDGVHKSQRYLTSWDVASGKQVDRRALDLDNKILYFLEGVSPDGRFATTFGGGGLLIYDVAADRPVQVTAENIMAPVAFSADSKLLAFAGNFSPVKGMERVHIREMSSGTELLTLAAGHAWERTFSPDGRYLLTASDGDLRLWELVSGKEVLRRHVATPVVLSGHPSFATCLAFAADGRSVAVGMPDTNVLVWDLAPATRSKRKLNAEDLDRLWTELAGEDAMKAYRAAGTLIADPERTLPFLRERLHPIKEDAPRIRKLVADLDSEQFLVRDAARKELENMDDAAHAVLRQALKEAKSLETRRRLKSLLTVSWLIGSPTKLRQVRAIMVLEQIGDAEARRALEHLADGAAEARQTREAAMALRRLANGRR